MLGRYIQSDPIGLNGGLNAYDYVGGNALGSFDVLGLEQCSLYQRGYPHYHSNNKGDSHWYELETKICSSSNPICNVFNVFEELRKYPAPTFNNVRQKSNQIKINNNDVSYAWPVGSVAHKVCTSLIINETLSTHLLYPGIVMREVIQKRDGVYISTLGFGTGRLGALNSDLKSIWNKVDNNIKRGLNE